MRRPGMRPRNSLTGGRYESKYGPPVLTALMESWGLTAGERTHLWRALCQSAWSTPQQWREALIAYHPTREDAAAFLHGTCSPQQVIGVLEALVSEQRLSRHTATRIEERLLAHTTRQGDWCGAHRWQTPGGASAPA